MAQTDILDPRVGHSHDADDRLGLYVHIPFCLTKCTYCDFNTYAGIEHQITSVVAALDTELRLWCRRSDVTEFNTVFFGGGTPSFIPPSAIQQLLDSARSDVGISRTAEITLEANPDNVTPNAVRQWRDAGVNRMSIGVQSFNDDLLASLSRRHGAKDATDAIDVARASGIDNLSIDLMYGLPNQSLEQWTESLNIAIGLDLPHLSLYCLQIEATTPMHISVGRGELPTPDDDLAADMYELAMDALDLAGYEHYEISNWCRPGKRSSHNVIYWQNRRYLGIGPGAHSQLGGARFWNMKSPTAYVRAIRETADSFGSDIPRVAIGSLAIDGVENTSVDMQMAETMMLGLRLREGVSMSEFERRYGVKMGNVYKNDIAELRQLGLINTGNGHVRLTRRGRLLGNEVFERFV